MTTQMLALLLVALPLVTGAITPIQVNVWTSPDDQTMVSASGVARKLITAGDMEVFRITEDHLKRGIHALNGAAPDHVYLRDPTGDSGNQFTINNWPQTFTILGVEDYELFDYREVNFTIANYNLTNMEDKQKIVGGDILFDGYDSIINSWRIPLLEKTGQQIHYKFNLKDGKGKFNYVNDWGRSLTQLNRKKLVATYNHTLDYQQMINIRQVLLKGIGFIRVTYQASLDGSAIGHFKVRYNGRNFWPFDVNAALRQAQVAPTFTITEEISFVYAISFNIEYQFKDLRTEVNPGLMYDLEEELIVNPTDL